MILVDRVQMQAIDRYAIEVLKVPALSLVERASMAVLKHINLNKFGYFGVVVGVGNNGADGLALARNLLARYKDVEIFIIGDVEKASPEFKLNLESCEMLCEEIYYVESIEDLENMEKRLSNVNLIVDAIFGTGLNRPVTGIYATVISIINNVMKYKISIDIPSGLDASTGQDLGEVVDADLIVTMQLMKTGLYEREAYKRKCVIEDIGIPQKAIDSVIYGLVN
ncbi:NAD(P)H-hydrate epimerase [Anaerococcus degeneri]|uniref:NAD(P)H-hydrate epimerase n=1 Tax=Anaerococcus degeneri TaxID=361500 RepID=A0ABS7YXA4_9FIRM|nr:NAD(P)H-hydrate epimerase [Anaerococcus degeneri]MBP2015988.1 NAD(P)H-hydrate epimerase [Anaerococcus degeneri]MCA2095734.1 NAD(P)H-hydrate epimerase [Anaerococcus degeneri]